METNAAVGTETNAVVETRMLTVAAGVRSAMRLYAKHNNDDMNLRSEDFAVVKNFLSSPGAYVTTRAKSAEIVFLIIECDGRVVCVLLAVNVFLLP